MSDRRSANRTYWLSRLSLHAMRSHMEPTQIDHTCVICSYDLRADPRAACPECGTPFAERERIMQGRSAASTRARQAAAWAFGIIVLVPWVIILALLTAVLLDDWLT